MKKKKSNIKIFMTIGASVSLEKNVSQDAMSTVDEVFASVDECNTMSSRTVSQDKISTITEVSNCIYNCNTSFLIIVTTQKLLVHDIIYLLISSILKTRYLRT